MAPGGPPVRKTTIIFIDTSSSSFTYTSSPLSPTLKMAQVLSPRTRPSTPDVEIVPSSHDTEVFDPANGDLIAVNTDVEEYGIEEEMPSPTNFNACRYLDRMTKAYQIAKQPGLLWRVSARLMICYTTSDNSFRPSSTTHLPRCTIFRAFRWTPPYRSGDR